MFFKRSLGIFTACFPLGHISGLLCVPDHGQLSLEKTGDDRIGLHCCLVNDTYVYVESKFKFCC